VVKKWTLWLTLALGVIHVVSDGKATIGAAKQFGLIR
jgi:hypothetical protein